jgi:hypothetical protein
MAYDPGFPNAAEDAHLVEQKPGTSSTVDDGGLSLTVDTDDGSLSTYHKPDYSQLSTATDPVPSASDTGATLEYTDNGNRYRWTGTYWQQTHLKGALNIHDADVHNSIVNQYIHQHTVTTTTLAVASAPNDYQITVVSAVGFAINDYIHVNTTTIETTHPKILNIVGNVFTLDRRLDKAHFIGDEVIKVYIDISTTAGTLVTPQEFFAGPPPGEIWHLTRLLFEMTHSTAGDLGLFGDLPALTNGVLLRAKVNGNYGTLTNWKTNANIKTDMFDVVFDNRSGGGGTWGTTGRGTFREAGAVLRLDGNTSDQFELYVQDDLTGLLTFTMKVQGHLEGA